MDMFSFDLATKRYRVTNLGFDYVYGEFQWLGDFLLYLADPDIQLFQTGLTKMPEAHGWGFRPKESRRLQKLVIQHQTAFLES